MAQGRDLVEGYLYQRSTREEMEMELAYIFMMLEFQGQERKYVFAVPAADLVGSGKRFYVRENADLMEGPFFMPDINIHVIKDNPIVVVSRRFKRGLELGLRATGKSEPVVATFRA